MVLLRKMFVLFGVTMIGLLVIASGFVAKASVG